MSASELRPIPGWDEPKPGSKVEVLLAAPADDLRIPKFNTNWKPPKMECPRPNAGAVLTKTEQKQERLREEIATEHGKPTPAGQVAAGDVGTEPEEVEPDAYVFCRTGEIILVGLEPDEEGRITIPADLVNSIKRQIAWSPAR